MSFCETAIQKGGRHGDTAIALVRQEYYRIVRFSANLLIFSKKTFSL